MFKWVPKVFRKVVVWFLVLQIKMFEKKEMRPLLVKFLELKVGVITEQELQSWFAEEIYGEE